MGIKMTEQEYEEKKIELLLKTWDNVGKAEGAKSQRKHDKYMQKALKSMVDEANFRKEYERLQEQDNKKTNRTRARQWLLRRRALKLLIKKKGKE